jgi:hypothetical protein
MNNISVIAINVNSPSANMNAIESDESNVIVDDEPEELNQQSVDIERFDEDAQVENFNYNSRLGRARAKTLDLLYEQELVIIGNHSSDMDYSSLATGDVNGDNVDDLIIGASYAGFITVNRSMCGEVYVIYGDMNLTGYDYINLNSTNNSFTPYHHDIIIYGAEADDNAGTSVAALDLNGDNIDDIVIGARGADGLNNTRNSCGEVHIIFGKSNLPELIDLNTTNASLVHSDHEIYGPDLYDQLGESIDVGNVDGDNYEDLLLGVYSGFGKNNQAPLAGEAYVVFGNSTGSFGDYTDLNTSVEDLVIYGNDTMDSAAKSVCLGDLDDDGLDDIIISAPESSGYNNSNVSVGEVYIIYGDTRDNLNKTGTTKREWDLNTEPANVILWGLNKTETLGSSLAVGNIDNDNYNDILIGVVDGAGPPGSGKTNTGKVYLYYGTPRATEDSVNVNLTYDNVTMIFGAEIQDGTGYEVASADLDNDNFSDIIIAAPSGDSIGNQRIDGGDVYVIYGMDRATLGDVIDLNYFDNTYSTKHYDKVIFGRRFNDELGRAMVINDINNDGRLDLNLVAPKGDGYNLKPYNTGNIHVIFGKPSLTNDNVILLDGGGPAKNTCYARYKNYTFRANISVDRFQTDLDEVEIKFAPNSISEFTINWNATTDNFSSLNYDHVYITDNSSSKWIDGKNVWQLYITLIFNWSYQYESLTTVNIRSINYEGLEFINPFNFVFKVENDLDFYGNLSVLGEYQGELSSNVWARGGENMSWGGQKVVYGNTDDVYPSNNEFNVTLWDTKGIIAVDDNSSGKNFSIDTRIGNVTNLGEFYILNITKIPYYSCHGTHYLAIMIDADNVEFTNSSPSNTTWMNSKIVNCGVSITDINQSNVDARSIEYRTTKDGGDHWSLFWMNAGLNGSSNDTYVDVNVNAEFEDGIDNYIKWRAIDAVGNGYSYSENFNVWIDTESTTFETPIPSPTPPQPFEDVICGITVKDSLSGVDAKSIQYAYSTDKGQSWSKWINAQQNVNASEIECLVSVKFVNGDNNYIKWRARDVAGNAYNESEYYWVRVNIALDPDAPNATLFSPRDKYTLPAVNPTLRWTGFDPNGDEITYDVFVSTDIDLVKNLQSSARVANDINETKLEVQLDDGNTYYWKVIPSDGLHVGICVSGIWSFTIVTTANIPTVKLNSPFNRTIINETSVELYWMGTFTGIEFVKYNVFWDTTPQFVASRVEDHLSMSYTLADLEDNTTYYWTIIPFAGDKIEGICQSGVWSFDVNFSFKKVSNITLSGPDEIEIWQGENKTYELNISNLGNFYDAFDLSFDPGKLGVNVKIDDVISLVPLTLELDINESKNSTLQLTIPTSMPPLETVIHITAKSRTTEVFVTHSIKVVVHHEDYTPPPVDTDDGQIINIDETNVIWLFIAVIIILVAILGFVLFIRVRKTLKGDEEEEEEEEESEAEGEEGEEKDEMEEEEGEEEKEAEDEAEKEGETEGEEEEPEEPATEGEPEPEEEVGEGETPDLPTTPTPIPAAVPPTGITPAAPAGEAITPAAPAAPTPAAPTQPLAMAMSLDEIPEAKRETDDEDGEPELLPEASVEPASTTEEIEQEPVAEPQPELKTVTPPADQQPPQAAPAAEPAPVPEPKPVVKPDGKEKNEEDEE